MCLWNNQEKLSQGTTKVGNEIAEPISTANAAIFVLICHTRLLVSIFQVQSSLK